MVAQLVGSAGTFTLTVPLFNGAYVCEAEMIRHDNKLWMFYGGTNEGGMPCSVLKIELNESTMYGALSGTSLSFGAGNGCIGQCRFPYVFSDNRGRYYVAGVNSDVNGDVYLYSSVDLVTWRRENGGTPILTQRPGTGWEKIWNVAILPVGDTWHLLAETDGVGGLGTRYASAPRPSSTGAISFDAGAQDTIVLPNAGNPHLRLAPDGRNVVCTHGVRLDERFGGDWYTTLSTAPLDDWSDWTTHKDSFAIGRIGVDICDPSVDDGPDGCRILVSYDQTKIRMLRSARQFSSITSCLC